MAPKTSNFQFSILKTFKIIGFHQIQSKKNSIPQMCNSPLSDDLNPIPPRLISNLFPLGGGRCVSHPVELDTKNFLHQNFSLGGLRVSIADFGYEGPGFDSQ